ncbi:hypothetical protein BC830DRAFT_1120584 [Chytriomyces sp. MP71]|nr:hypothetical protein BC830DRAFT_1120584 [Chytriomyces sp. MP71]
MPVSASLCWLSDTPPELIAQMFQWLSPKEAIALRRLSRGINACISTKFFARMSLYAATTSEGTSSTMSRAHCELFLRAPASFKAVLVQINSTITEFCYNGNRNDGEKSPDTIPADLSRLSHLEHVAIESSCLIGPIVHVSDLSSLKTLNLFGNALTGAIPTTLSRQLTSLSLDLNTISSPIPASLGSLRSFIISSV